MSAGSGHTESADIVRIRPEPANLTGLAGAPATQQFRTDPGMAEPARHERRGDGGQARGRALVDGRGETGPAGGERLAGWTDALLTGGSDLVSVTDADGVLRFVSPSVEASLGHAAVELVGRPWAELVHPDDLERCRRELHPTVDRADARAPVRLRMRHRDGSYRVLDVRVRDLTDDPAVRGHMAHAQDVTGQLASAAALELSERRFGTLVRNSTDMIVLLDEDGTLHYSSPATRRILGFDDGAVTVRSLCIFDYVHPADLHRARAALRRAVDRAATAAPVDLRLRHFDGSWRVVEVLGGYLLDDPADRHRVMFSGRDVTDRRRSEQLVAEQTELLESMARGATLDSVLLRSVRMIERRLPGSAASIGLMTDDGSVWHEHGPSLDRDALQALNASHAASELGVAIRGSAELCVFPDLAGDDRWVGVREPLLAAGFRSCWVFPLQGPGTNGQVGVLAVFGREGRGPGGHEIEICERALSLAALAVDRRRSEVRLQHQALHDDLTGLPNRTLLVDRIERALVRARRKGIQVAVLFVDLDRFKVLNDSLGHAAGDRVLQEVASRFTSSIRDGDTVGRFGGDEFVVLCEDVLGEAGAVEVAERLADQLRAPFDVGGAALVMTASIGIAVSPVAAAVAEQDEAARPSPPGEADVDQFGAESLIRDADAAMYRAKDLGRSGHVVFEPSLHRRVMQRLEIEAALRLALDQGELSIHYQPQVRLVDGSIVGVEALVRWDRPGRGLLPPDRFIPLAEETGLVIPLDRWVFREACRQVAQWRSSGLAPDLKVSSNLSALHLAEPDLVDVVAEVLAEHGLPADAVALEVTESVLVTDVEATAAGLSRLHALGIRLSIDDFGTGYASLDSVRRFSMADELKVDRSFVADLEGSEPRDRAIVWASVVLARALGLTAVAEGVETERQRAVLLELGCDLGQGYFFSRPLPADEMERLLGISADPPRQQIQSGLP